MHMLSFKKFISEAFQLTLRYHDRLNPKLWSHDALKPHIAAQLLDMSSQFAAFSGLSKDAISDIVLTGGNANYNYTKFSDIDVHLIYTHANKTPDELFDCKVQWSEAHPDARIAGYNVEFFAQPADEKIKPHQGAWSLVQSKWIQVPKHLDDVAILKDPKMISKVKHHMSVIRHLLARGSAAKIKQYRDRLKSMRVAGLERPGGEFSIENVLYKDLRNRGLLERLKLRQRELTTAKKES